MLKLGKKVAEALEKRQKNEKIWPSPEDDMGGASCMLLLVILIIIPTAVVNEDDIGKKMS